MTANELCDDLERLRACAEARKWVEGKTLAEAWAKCDRGDWMLWLAARHIGDPGWPRHEQIVLCACDCAERALQYVPDGEDRPRLAIEAARAWTENPCAETRAAAWAAAIHASGAAGAAGAANEAVWATWDIGVGWSAPAAATYAAAAADAAAAAQADLIRARVPCVG